MLLKVELKCRKDKNRPWSKSPSSCMEVDRIVKKDICPINMCFPEAETPFHGSLHSYKARMFEQSSHPLKAKRYLKAVTRVQYAPSPGYKMSILRLRLTIISCTESIVFFSRSVSVALV